MSYLNSEQLGDSEDDRRSVFDVYCEDEQGDKLTFAYIEIPKFNKDEEHLDTMWDKWMFVLRNLSHLMDRPPAQQERVFTRLFEQAEIAKLSKTELRNYTYGMDTLRDYKNGLATAKKQGIALGRQEGIDRLIIVQPISDCTALVSSDRKFYKYDV